MAYIGKIATGRKKEGERFPKKLDGFFIYKQTKKDPGKATEAFELDNQAMGALLKYNFGDKIEAGLAKIDKEGLEPAEKKKAIAKFKKEFFEAHKEKCSEIPIYLTRLDSFATGRTCWPNSNRARDKFCGFRKTFHDVVKERATEFKSRSKAPQVAERNTGREDDEGRTVWEDVNCVPSKCVYAQEPKDGNRVCKRSMVLGVHLDLPGKDMSLSPHLYASTGWYTEKSIVDSLLELQKICGIDNIVGVPLKMVLRHKTILDKDQKFQKVPVVHIFLRDIEPTALLEVVAQNVKLKNDMLEIQKSEKELIDLCPFTEEDLQAAPDYEEKVSEETTNTMEESEIKESPKEESSGDEFDDFAMFDED